MAYIQRGTDFPTFKGVWIISDTYPRTERVSPNPFTFEDLWSTPETSPEFWAPCCEPDGNVRVLSPGKKTCCRMCPETWSEELLPYAWCKGWAPLSGGEILRTPLENPSQNPYLLWNPWQEPFSEPFSRGLPRTYAVLPYDPLRDARFLSDPKTKGLLVEVPKKMPLKLGFTHVNFHVYPQRPSARYPPISRNTLSR